MAPQDKDDVSLLEAIGRDVCLVCRPIKSWHLSLYYYSEAIPSISRVNLTFWALRFKTGMNESRHADTALYWICANFYEFPKRQPNEGPSLNSLRSALMPFSLSLSLSRPIPILKFNFPLLVVLVLDRRKAPVPRDEVALL